MTSPSTPPPGCPMHQKSSTSQSSPTENDQSSCPFHYGDALNPSNQIPANLAQQPAPGQRIELPTERSISSIPKSNSEEKWEYPSPQQFYNALRRKGWETPEEHVETMVDIHNFLNEEAWSEVLKWEKMHECECAQGPTLLRFRGRPQDLSPKARLLGLFYGTPRPFDRHDWTVDRCGKEVRYVIDYYEAPEEQPGVPVFHLDVRPAVDNMESLCDRVKVASKEFWARVWSTSQQKNA
ncbi:uncharacterized protein VTP21DRAFT_6446 [Calcarisporiella thermophila]|uniref:uncharacterized protein n=1 Tax=Calcarisporiella thermophila TaxID=911321 RepID=UPI0037436206